MNFCPTPLRALVAATLLALAAGAPVQAGVVPVGVHNDVGYDTVVDGWGWTLVSRSDTLQALSIEALLPACCRTTWC